jgi:hypothetical protein
MNKEQNKMEWANFRNESRLKPSSYNCETKKKMLKRNATIKMDTTGQRDVTQKEGRTWKETRV